MDWILDETHLIQLPADIYYIGFLPVVVRWNEIGMIAVVAHVDFVCGDALSRLQGFGAPARGLPLRMNSMRTPSLLQSRRRPQIVSQGEAEIPVVRGVDLDIHPGEMVAITGASGVGKSTLLHILGALEPPTAGQGPFRAEAGGVFKYSDRALSVFRNKSLGFVFQFHYLLPEFTALENVMMPALIAGHSKKACEKQAKELLEFVGLGTAWSIVRRSSPEESSSGSRSRAP